MEFDFSYFCSCSPEEYQIIHHYTDYYADLGAAYQFPRCHMAPGCAPQWATLSFWRNTEGYHLGFQPRIFYQGTSQGLAKFFQTSSHSFPTFEAMTQRLRSLKQELGQESLPLLYRVLNAALQSLVLGQTSAVEEVAFKLYGHIWKKNPARPLSLIFYGPTGVGKSELGKAIAPVLNRQCGKETYQFVWTELNTFTQAHSVYRLTGAPPGYVGYDDQPIFEAVRRNPYTVFMFDELEKAHPEVLKVFMSILDEGRCTARKEDSQGNRELDFRHCVFLFTTNQDLSENGSQPLGFTGTPEKELTSKSWEQPLLSQSPMGTLAHRLFLESETARQAMVRSGALKEIAGRFSGIIPFRPLDSQAKIAITAKQIVSLGKEYGLQLEEVDPEIVQAVTPKESFSVRSSLGILEGIFTPLFAQQPRSQGTRFKLAGPLENMALVPLAPLPQKDEPVKVVC